MRLKLSSTRACHVTGGKLSTLRCCSLSLGFSSFCKGLGGDTRATLQIMASLRLTWANVATQNRGSAVLTFLIQRFMLFSGPLRYSTSRRYVLEGCELWRHDSLKGSVSLMGATLHVRQTSPTTIPHLHAHHTRPVPRTSLRWNRHPYP